jgi:cell wall-associated NlpC family hydrolase
MTIFQDIQARNRRNPREIAEEFAQTDPAVARPDTFSGQFQPVYGPETPEMSAAEQSALQSMQDVSNESVRLVEQTQQLAGAQAAARQREMQRAFGGQAGQAQQSNLRAGDVGYAYQPDGNLSESRQQVLRRTAGFAGTPYQLGGRTVKGIDCSGLVMSVYNSMGFDVSQHSASWQGRNIPGARTAVSNLRPGDLVAWKDGSHIAVYAGNGMIWDASRNRGTSLRPLWAPQNQVYGIAVRLPGE